MELLRRVDTNSQHTLSSFVTIVHTVTRTQTCLDCVFEPARLVDHLIVRSKSRLLVTLATALAEKGVTLQCDILLPWPTLYYNKCRKNFTLRSPSLFLYSSLPAF